MESMIIVAIHVIPLMAELLTGSSKLVLTTLEGYLRNVMLWLLLHPQRICCMQAYRDITKALMWPDHHLELSPGSENTIASSSPYIAVQGRSTLPWVATKRMTIHALHFPMLSFTTGPEVRSNVSPHQCSDPSIIYGIITITQSKHPLNEWSHGHIPPHHPSVDRYVYLLSVS